MSKVFFPQRFIDIPASRPHPANTEYRVSVGVEHWGDGSPQYVYKIQMVYDGAVAGRKSPSFPDGSDDLDRVLVAMAEIKKGGGKRSRGVMTSVGEEPGIPLAEAHAVLKFQEGIKS